MKLGRTPKWMADWQLLIIQTAVGFFLGVAIVADCANLGGNAKLSGNNGKWYAVTTDSTPFYRYAPQQGYRADQQLPKDSLMKVINPFFGYCKVQLQNG